MNDRMSEPKMIEIEEAARLLGVNLETLARWDGDEELAKAYARLAELEKALARIRDNQLMDGVPEHVRIYAQRKLDGAYRVCRYCGLDDLDNHSCLQSTRLKCCSDCDHELTPGKEKK